MVPKRDKKSIAKTAEVSPEAIEEKTDHNLGWTKPAVDEFHNLGYVDELKYAVDCVLNDVEPMYGVSGALGLACNQVIEAMYESAREGKVIKGEW